MSRIIYVGIDVHSTNFTFCSLEPFFGGDDRLFARAQMRPGVRSVEKYISNLKDEQVKDYIRMRDDHKAAFKKVKQQINAFCLRHGYRYSGKSNWTIAHMKWLYELELDPLDKEILNEYLQTATMISQ